MSMNDLLWLIPLFPLIGAIVMGRRMEEQP